MPRLDQLLPLLEADPGDTFVRYGVAMEYARQGQHAEAMRHFEEIFRRDPDYVPAYFMAGRTQEQAGEPEAAKALYRRGIETARRVGDAHAAAEIGEALAALE